MEEAARSQPLVPVSGVPSSRPAGPSESEMLRQLREFAQENPWANRLFANPELVAERLQGYDGAEDTPPATHINPDKHAVSAPPASAAGRDLSTPERTIEHPSPTTDVAPSTANVAPTQPAASVTPLVFVTGRGRAGFHFVTPPLLRPGVNSLPFLPAPYDTGPWPGCGAGRVFYFPR